MILDAAKYVVKSITSRFTRSFLTSLSILIGIMAVYALISFGQGVSSYVTDIGEQAGSDKLFAQPKGAGVPGSGGSFLSKNDLDTIRKVNGVSVATPMMMKQAEVNTESTGRGKFVFVGGLSVEPEEQRLVESSFGGFGIMEGRELKRGDYSKINIGYQYSVPDKIFAKPVRVGDKLYLNGVRLEVVGIYEQIGNPQDDANIYMTLDRMKDLFAMGDEYAAIFIQADRGVDPNALADRIEDRLRRAKGEKQGQETFFVSTYEQLLETFGTVLTVINAILVIIAGISVIVAAVNIMNTMYTAVLERTKEIGIMKAIGARNSYILMLFFLESGALGLIGGIIGVILGYGLATLGGAIAASAGYALLQPAFPWWLTAGCLLFAFLVGAGSGFLPALQASKQKPVDALRYE